MKITVLRYNSDSDHTNSVMLIDGKFECYGLEDEFRNIKVWGETRIPNGIYKIEFRKVGGFHNRYSKRYGNSWHKGMLEIKDVPNFTYVLIHKGNDDDDTAACYLVGDSNARGNNWIGDSASAYERMYPKIRNALMKGEEATIEFLTLDNPYD